MPKYKTQTNDLTEVIESGGGGGKLYRATYQITLDPTYTGITTAIFSLYTYDKPTTVNYNKLLVQIGNGIYPTLLYGNKIDLTYINCNVIVTTNSQRTKIIVNSLQYDLRENNKWHVGERGQDIAENKIALVSVEEVQ